MKKLSARGADPAFTLVEVLVVTVVILVLVLMLVPQAPDHHRRTPTLICMSHLKQGDVSFLMWASDHQDRFPFQVPVYNGGTKELIATGLAFQQFQTLSDYGFKTDLLVCPQDIQRHPAATYAVINNTNLSYFVNIDASTTNAPSSTMLTGDRDLQVNNRPIGPGLLRLTAGEDVNWQRQLHPTGGCLGFADGHAEFVKTWKLNAVVQRQTLATNRLLIP